MLGAGSEGPSVVAGKTSHFCGCSVRAAIFPRNLGLGWAPPSPASPGLFGVTPPHGALSVVSVCCLPFLPECKLRKGEDFTISSAKSAVPRILLGK